MLPPTHPAAKDIQYRDIHEVSGDVIPINMVKGIGHLRDPRLNKVFMASNYHILRNILRYIFPHSVSRKYTRAKAFDVYIYVIFNTILIMKLIMTQNGRIKT